MKKLILSAFALGSLMSVNSQVLLSETFNSGPTATTTIPGWTSINGDGLTSYSTSLPNGFYIQNNVAGNQSWNSGSSAQSDDWLIRTASITIPASANGTFLTWRGTSYEATYLEDYEVRLSTVGNTPTDFNAGTLLLDVNSEPFAWTNHSVDMSAYEGQTIYLAFHCNSVDENILWLDDVLLYQPFSNDMRITNVEVDNGLEGDRTFTITCQNYGANTVTAFDLDWSFDGGTTTTENITGLSLVSGQTYEVDVTVNGVPAGAAQDFDAEITTSDDDNSNNVFATDFDFEVPVPQFIGTDSHGNPFNLHDALSSGQAIILDFMASWCGPCETSTPALAQLVENNGSGTGNLQALALSVESTDNNTVMNGLNWYGGYYAYPKFAYTTATNYQYYHYSVNHGFNSGSIPFFVMICPNISDPAHSDIVKYDVGYSGGMFNAYQTELDNCSTAYASIDARGNETFMFSIYPNPSNDVTNVEFNLNQISNVQVQVVNSLGQIVFNNNLGDISGSNKVLVNTSDLDAGLYFINVIVDGVVSTERLSVVK
jgi:thiol-disulfide isomerase/thioredoxin